MFKLGYAVLLALCAAILVHIGIVFLIPRLSEPEVLTRLQVLSQTRDPLLISGIDNAQALPGLDPFFRYRVCFYNLDDGPFQLLSKGDVLFFSAAIMSESGDVMFSITDRQIIDRALNVLVRASANEQRLSRESTDNTTITSSVPVFVPELKGFAVVRVFVPDNSWNEIADSFLNNISCQTAEANG